MKKIKVNEQIEFNDHELVFIMGPCQIESKDHTLKIASFLKSLSQKLKIPIIFKASFDKANRTSIHSQRGIGIDQGLKILQLVKTELELPVTTDIHDLTQAAAIAEVVDIIQIPALLCRQSDLLIAAAKTNKVINIKKGQFLSPTDMAYCAEKVTTSGNNQILLTERGTCFGYRDLVVDFRGIYEMQKLQLPIIFDATHSVQIMGGANGKSSGNREYVFNLAKAAVVSGVQGIFIECHDDPDNAPSDGSNMIKLNNLEKICSYLQRLKASINSL